MRNFFKNSFLIIVIISFLSVSTAFADDLCAAVSRPYVVGFFNGMNNSYNDATKNLVALERLVKPLNTQYVPIRYTIFYNQTKGFVSDVTEVFAQKYKELGLSISGDPESYFELLWYMTKNTDINFDEIPKSGLLEFLYEVFKMVKEYVDLSDFIIEASKITSASVLANMVEHEYNHTTLADYQIHDEKLENLLARDYKVILVGHSQGNLFVSHAYEDIVGRNGLYSDLYHRVDVMHVAPPNASDNLQGPYILNDYDTVIRKLKYVFDNVPDANVHEQKGTDERYHSFIQTYLALGSQSRNIMNKFIEDKLKPEYNYNYVDVSAEIAIHDEASHLSYANVEFVSATEPGVSSDKCNSTYDRCNYGSLHVNDYSRRYSYTVGCNGVEGTYVLNLSFSSYIDYCNTDPDKMPPPETHNYPVTITINNRERVISQSNQTVSIESSGCTNGDITKTISASVNLSKGTGLNNVNVEITPSFP